MRYKTNSNQNHWSSFVFVGHALIFICFCLLWSDVLNCIGWCMYKMHMSVFWWYNTCWTARLDQIWKNSQAEKVIFCNFFLHKVCSLATSSSQRNWSSSKHEHGQWVRERERAHEGEDYNPCITEWKHLGGRKLKPTTMYCCSRRTRPPWCHGVGLNTSLLCMQRLQYTHPLIRLQHIVTDYI